MKAEHRSWHGNVYVILDGDFEQVGEIAKMLCQWELIRKEKKKDEV